MPPGHVHGEFEGARGARLFWQRWLPETPPDGLLLICHGLGEHSGSILEELGYSVEDVEALRSAGVVG